MNHKEFEELLEEFQESYQGYYGGVMKDAKEEYAYDYIENTGMLSEAPECLKCYFDYEAFARDLFMDGYSEYNGHVFLDV